MIINLNTIFSTSHFYLKSFLSKVFSLKDKIFSVYQSYQLPHKVHPSKSMSAFTYSQKGNDGSFDTKEAEKVIEKIQNASQAILFDKNTLVKELRAGTCSAVSLDWAVHILHAEKKIPEDFSIFAKEKWEQYRAEQAAFNTFKIKPEAKNLKNISQEKIRPLIAYYDLNVIDSTEIIKISKKNDFDSHQLIQRLFSEMKEGVYLVRQVDPNDEKVQGENCGHTMIMTRKEKEIFFFDPNFGNFELGKTSLPDRLSKFSINWTKQNYSKEFADFLCFVENNYSTYYISDLQFHKLEEKKESFFTSLLNSINIFRMFSISKTQNSA